MAASSFYPFGHLTPHEAVDRIQPVCKIKTLGTLIFLGFLSGEAGI
jgi:hypothetical protein